MNRNLMDEFYRDPAFYDRLVAKAHRERSRAMAAGFAWLAGYVKEKFALHFRLRPARWIERLG